MTIENEIISYSVKRHNEVKKELELIKNENIELKSKLKAKEEVISQLIKWFDEWHSISYNLLKKQSIKDNIEPSERKKFYSHSDLSKLNLPSW